MKKNTAIFSVTLVILLLWIVCFQTSAVAQESTCKIEGKILDDQNKPVPYAAIMLVAASHGQTRGTSSDGNGEFRFDGLQPGKYSVTIRRVGFEQMSRDVQVTIGQTTSVNYTMIPSETDTEPAPVALPSSLSRSRPDAGALQWYSLDEGVVLAQQSNKKLLVHVYTDWCGWCKKMDKEVFTNPGVKNALRAYFIPVKLNAESPRELSVKGRQLSEMAIAKEMGVNGYPTTVFLYPNAEPLGKVAGYIESEDFAKLLRNVGQNR